MRRSLTYRSGDLIPKGDPLVTAFLGNPKWFSEIRSECIESVGFGGSVNSRIYGYRFYVNQNRAA